MNAHAPTPEQLIEQWTPMLRGLAYRTGTDLDDILQEAWLLAATMRPGADDFTARWVSAVRCHAATQRPGVTVRPSARKAKGEVYIGSAWLQGSGGEDPCSALLAAETVARRVGGEHGIRQEIELARAPWEIAQARGCSARHGRRQAARLRELEGVQGDLFGCDESDGEGEE